MIPKDGLDVKYFLAAFRRRLWYIMLPFFLVSISAVLYCIKAPKLYKSSALVLIQPQEVPTEFVKSTVTSDIQSRLNAITEQIMSRSRVEEIVEEFDLYPDIRRSGDMYAAVEQFWKNIDIEVKGSGRRRRGGTPSSFSVSFQGKKPAKLRDVTEAIANLYIDYNFQIRAEQAARTTKFLERELARVKDELRGKEEEVRRFKEEYFGFLPGQMQNNYNILTRLQQHLDSINDSLQKTEDRKVLRHAQLNRLEALGSAASMDGDLNSRPVTLEELQQKLSTLKSRYSDKHPDVVRLKSIIARLEKEQQAAGTDANSAPLDTPSSSDQADRLMRVKQKKSLTEMQMMDVEIRSLRQEKEKTIAQIKEYQQRIEKGPKIEMMFVDLRRDYNRANENYQSLLEKKLEAELAENLERTQKGEQFKILDHARVPYKPYKPNIPQILAMGFMLGLGLGFGLAFLREYLDPTFWSRKEVESVLELPVLVSIPVIQTDRERRRSIFKKVATVCLLLTMSSTLLYVLFVLWKKNPGFLPIPL